MAIFFFWYSILNFSPPHSLFFKLNLHELLMQPPFLLLNLVHLNLLLT